LPARGQLKWGSAENLQQKIDDYFVVCKVDGDIPTMAGICLALDIVPSTYRYYSTGEYEERLSKKAAEAKDQLLIDAGDEHNLILDTDENGILCKDAIVQDGDEIDTIKARVSLILKTARVRMDNTISQAAFRAKNPAYHIFYQKNAFGYTDQPSESTLNATQLNLNIKIVNNEQKRPVIEVSKD
jgi:hypothetical protein